MSDLEDLKRKIRERLSAELAAEIASWPGRSFDEEAVAMARAHLDRETETILRRADACGDEVTVVRYTTDGEVGALFSIRRKEPLEWVTMTFTLDGERNL